MNPATDEIDEGPPPRLRRGRVLAAGLLAAAVVAVGAATNRRPAAPAKPPSRAASAPPPASAPVVAADLGQWCRRVVAQVAGIAQPACRDSGLQAGAGRSVQGVPLWWRDVLPVAGAPRFRILLLGGIHGDELASVALAFDWIARSHAAQARPMAPTAAVAWRFVPLLNPDGLMHVPSTRVNAHGVDLNRNFPTADWTRDAQPYWIQRTKKDPRRFPGTQALSEPESRWLLEQIDAFRPDLIVSVHAPYGLLDFDGPPPAPRRLGSLQLDPVGVYPGSLGNYGSGVRQVPVMTLELKNARQVPATELSAMWADLQRWIAQRVAQPGLQAAAQPPARPVRAARRQD
jgi:protein MpaA